jgi:hypothetical protein
MPDAQRRRAVVLGINLSALLMVIFGAGLQADARNVAILCFVLAVADMVMVQFLKQIWRKRYGR